MTRDEAIKHLSNMLRRRTLSALDKEAIKYAKEYIASCIIGTQRYSRSECGWKMEREE